MGGVVAGHAVDAGAGRGGGGAEVEFWVRGGVGVEARDRAGEELREVLDAANDVAADEVWVVGLVSGRGSGVGGEDGVAEAGGEAFDLVQDGLGHVGGGAVGDVAVCPAGVLVVGGAGGIEDALLGDEDEGFVGDAVLPGVAFGGGDFFQGSADVDRAGAAAGFGGPRDGFGESEVEFEDAGAVSVSVEFLAVRCRELIAGDVGESAGGGIEENGLGFGEGGEVFDFVIADDFAAEGAVMFCQGFDDLSGAAFGEGPADVVTGDGEHDSDGGGEGVFEWEDGVGGVSGEEGLGFG